VTAPEIELRATYRLQLSSDFGFADARALVPYLRDLGISHLYLSPSLQARRGSTHGYDVVDPRHFSRELGGPEELGALSGSARDAGMGVILDVVPNHMAADDQNRYWANPELRARFFDIEPETGVYRRFFDIGELAGVRQEDPAVFEETHELVIALVREGLIDGLRVDHPDGLADPAGYLAHLRDHAVDRVWIEKILDPGEHLRDWPVCGTVGYEFLNDACALFVDPAGEPALTALWEQVSGDRRPFSAYADEAKLDQVRGPFAQDVERLLRELPPDRRPERADLERALCSLPVYRTYVDPLTRTVDAEDRRWIEASGMDPAIAAMLLLEREAPAGFVTRFQQTTPAIMAKGVEDTAFYLFNRLAALNEVGGEPQQFGSGIEAFHRGNQERQRHWPASMLNTSTHDTKRSEDVRARMVAISELAEMWRRSLPRWRAANHRWKKRVEEAEAPDRNEEYLLYQTLLGTWPMDHSGKPSTSVPGEYVERIQNYMNKALNEAKINTSWVQPNEDWLAATRDFVGKILEASPKNKFLPGFLPMATDIAQLGAINSLTQTLLKLTSPGVPDIYQGNEIWDFSLVDPDNRRPVDYRVRRQMLESLGNVQPEELLAGWADGRIKLFLTQRVLQLRRNHPELFARGSYLPLGTFGTFRDSVVSFARQLDQDWVLVIAPRLTARVGFPPVGDKWQDTAVEIPEGLDLRDARNIFTSAVLCAENRRLMIGDAFAMLPLAVITNIR
jgi:(1->4)-alpha-D-glucan 1-alpha-D-glucosylmutase